MEHNIPGWDEYFMSLCYLVAMRSKDTSTKSGCVIVGPGKEILSTGYNSLPRGMDDSLEERYQRPLKYEFFEHCERNAIYNAARNGVSLLGSTLYVNWLPCMDCARAIIQAGISEVVIHESGQKAFLHSRNGKDMVWSQAHDLCWSTMEEGKVKVRWYRGPIVSHLTGQFSGKHYRFTRHDYRELDHNDEMIYRKRSPDYDEEITFR